MFLDKCVFRVPGCFDGNAGMCERLGRVNSSQNWYSHVKDGFWERFTFFQKKMWNRFFSRILFNFCTFGGFTFLEKSIHQRFHIFGAKPEIVGAGMWIPKNIRRYIRTVLWVPMKIHTKSGEYLENEVFTSKTFGKQRFTFWAQSEAPKMWIPISPNVNPILQKCESLFSEPPRYSHARFRRFTWPQRSHIPALPVLATSRSSTYLSQESEGF